MIRESEVPRFLGMGRRQLQLLATGHASHRSMKRFGSRPKESIWLAADAGSENSGGRKFPDNFVSARENWMPAQRPKGQGALGLLKVFFALLWIAMVLNLSPLFPQSWLWQHLKPVNGLVQRSFFLSWFAWCTFAGLLMWPQQRESPLTRQVA
jgi:hypothetical protein